MSLQGAFRALSDPTRREILLLLSRQDMSVGEVCTRFRITRTAVKKHLSILEEGGLVSAQTQGRERINRLSPEPLAAVADWISYFSQFWDTRLDALQAAIEADTQAQQQTSPPAPEAEAPETGVIESGTIETGAAPRTSGATAPANASRKDTQDE
ncbi:ArsR/SmtB family transcription factor [Tritonibacter horizontis]|uniref:Transcriptional repressor SdpR n=1 Tax=Tritonibacter horizontis TaxID=1768241 RepID=A0A132BS56_9RHOB|nr:transcriptional repressor SdpR [Tritonibacter horizontis]